MCIGSLGAVISGHRSLKRTTVMVRLVRRRLESGLFSVQVRRSARTTTLPFERARIRRAPKPVVTMFRNKLLRIALGLLSVGFMATTASAQVRPIPNTGCPNAPHPTTTGQPAIGQGFGVIAAPCRTTAGQPFIILGLPGVSALLPAPPACVRGCTIDCRPIVVLSQSAWRIVIPNDRNLIGVQLCAQTGCVEAARPACVLLHGALGIQITP
jgi:hypothetical protein